MALAGRKSAERLSTCDPRLQALINTAATLMDIVVVEGHRGRERQQRAFEEGHTTLQWPDSKHNKEPSLAVDVAPHRDSPPFIDWTDREAFYHMIGAIRGIAYMMDIEVRVGSDWDSDWDLQDQSFDDLPHIELIVDDS